jgi:hypothetical protein
MPRCDRRWANARSISASFWGVTERSIGDGVNVLPQALQRQRAVPERFFPNRTTFSFSWQCGQEMQTETMLDRIPRQRAKCHSLQRPRSIGTAVSTQTPKSLLSVPASLPTSTVTALGRYYVVMTIGAASSITEEHPSASLSRGEHYHPTNPSLYSQTRQMNPFTAISFPSRPEGSRFVSHAGLYESHGTRLVRPQSGVTACIAV